MSATTPGRIQRHKPAVRLAHGANVIALMSLIATGLALGDRLPGALVEIMGGHAVANETHRLGGLAYIIAALAAALLFHAAALHLMRDLTRFHRDEWRWPRFFLKDILTSSHRPAAFHPGRFNPAQRVVLTVLLCATALVGASGVYLYILPAAPRWIFILVIRTHVYGAWVMVAALCLHACAGLGVLRTHRGLLNAMFGDGTIRVQTAYTLWPGWTKRTLRNLEEASHIALSRTPMTCVQRPRKRPAGSGPSEHKGRTSKENCRPGSSLDSPAE